MDQIQDDLPVASVFAPCVLPPISAIEGNTGRYIRYNDLVPLGWSDGKEMTVEEWGKREFQLGFNAGLAHALDLIAISLNVNQNKTLLKG